MSCQVADPGPNRPIVGCALLGPFEVLRCRDWSGHRVTSLSTAHGYSVCCPGRVGPTVARTATASRIPIAAVAVSGMVYGAPKPDAAACGADAAPISRAAQAGQRRPGEASPRRPAAECGGGEPGCDQPGGRGRMPGGGQHQAAPGQVQGRRGEQQHRDQRPRGSAVGRECAGPGISAWRRLAPGHAVVHQHRDRCPGPGGDGAAHPARSAAVIGPCRPVCPVGGRPSPYSRPGRRSPPAPSGARETDARGHRRQAAGPGPDRVLNRRPGPRPTTPGP